MNARLVSTVAGEIRCAQVRGIITASGLADVLAAAQLLQSPETVAEVRAAALREAADAVWGMAYDEDAEDYGYDSIRDAWDGGTMDAAKYLRRMVDTAAKASPAREQSEPCPEHSPAAELARLRDLVAAVRALHTKYSDSDHCKQDDEQWPCLTLCALDTGTGAPQGPAGPGLALVSGRPTAGTCGVPDPSGVSCVKDAGHTSAAWPNDPHDGDPDSGRSSPDHRAPSGALTPEREQEIRARAEAATPGPWTVELEQCDCSDGLCAHGTYVSAVYASGQRRTEFTDFSDSDWQFVIRARTAVPALLAEIDRLRDRAERRRKRLVAAEADLLDIRGALSPSGRPRRVPMELGERVAPAVDWLLARVAELEARLAEYERPADEDPIAYALTEKAAEADGITRLMTPLQALRADEATEAGDDR